MRWIKIIHRDSPHSPRKDVRNTRWKLFFSPHFTAFLTKIHRVFYEFTLLNFSYLNQRFSWLFLSNQASSDSSLQTISISNNFLLFSNFYSFFKIIQEFQTKPLVLINFTFEPLRNNASAVFLFSKTERNNQSINYQIEYFFCYFHYFCLLSNLSSFTCMQVIFFWKIASILLK